MRVEVDPTICDGHGQCAAVAPDVYDLDDGGYCVISDPEIGPDREAQAVQGAQACPVQAIRVLR